MPGSLHPFVLHFSVALLVAGAALDLAGLLLHRESLLQAGRWNTIIGAVFLVLTVLSGLSAQASLGPHSAAGGSLLALHKGLGLLLLVAWVPTAAWRALSKLALPLRFRTLYLSLAFAGAALILAQTAMGSALVYWHGVGLSPEARATSAAPSPLPVPSPVPADSTAPR